MRAYEKLLKMLEDYKGELVTGVLGMAAATLAWAQGRRQANAQADATISDGVSQIVETSNALLVMVKTELDEERKHRVQCDERVRTLESEVLQLKRQLNA